MTVSKRLFMVVAVRDTDDYAKCPFTGNSRDTVVRRKLDRTVVMLVSNYGERIERFANNEDERNMFLQAMIDRTPLLNITELLDV